MWFMHPEVIRIALTKARFNALEQVFIGERQKDISDTDLRSSQARSCCGLLYVEHRQDSLGLL